MEFPLVLRDNQNKRKRGILLRNGKKNSAGNVITPSVTQVWKPGSHPKYFCSSFFSLPLPSSHLPSQSLIPTHLLFISHLHWSLPCIPHILVLLWLTSVLLQDHTLLTGLPVTSPLHPFLLYTKVFTPELPTTQRTMSQVLAKVLACLPSPLSQPLRHHSSTQSLYSSQINLLFFSLTCQALSCFCGFPTAVLHVWLALSLLVWPVSQALSCPRRLPYLPTSREHRMLLLFFSPLLFLFIISLCIFPDTQIRS